jgi:hypothetical protein
MLRRWVTGDGGCCHSEDLATKNLAAGSLHVRRVFLHFATREILRLGLRMTRSGYQVIRAFIPVTHIS